MIKSFRLQPGEQIRKAESLCVEHLGDREYYLHHTRGSSKWRIRQGREGVWLDLEDSPESLLVIMKL